MSILLDDKQSLKFNTTFRNSIVKVKNVYYTQWRCASMFFKSVRIGIAMTPLLSLVIWLFTKHKLLDFINIIFYVSLIIFIIVFALLIVQEGIFDTTSYGFRRLKFLLSSSKKNQTIKDDEFFNPKHAKKDHYTISSWVIPILIINLLYLVLAIVISFSI